MHVLLKYGFKYDTILPEMSDLNFSLIFLAAGLFTSMHSFKSDVFFFLISGFGELQYKKKQAQVKEQTNKKINDKRNDLIRTYDFDALSIECDCFLTLTSCCDD